MVVVVVVVGVELNSVVSSVVVGTALVCVGEGVAVVLCVVLGVGVVVVVVLRVAEDLVVVGAIPGAPCGATDSRETCTTAKTSTAIVRRPPAPAANASAGRWYHGAPAGSAGPSSSDTRRILG